MKNLSMTNSNYLQRLKSNVCYSGCEFIYKNPMEGFEFEWDIIFNIMNNFHVQKQNIH